MKDDRSSPGAEAEGVFGPGRIVEEGLLRAQCRKVGQGVRVFVGSRIIGPDVLEIGERSQIDEGTFLNCGEGLSIGRYVHLAVGTFVTGGGRCRIGDFVGVGSGVRLVTGTDRVEGGLIGPGVPQEYRSAERGWIEIGNHAVIFTNTVVLPQVRIGEGAVVAAGSLVHHALKPWTIYAGNPLVAVGDRQRGPVLEKAQRIR